MVQRIVDRRTIAKNTVLLQLNFIMKRVETPIASIHVSKSALLCLPFHDIVGFPFHSQFSYCCREHFSYSNASDRVTMRGNYIFFFVLCQTGPLNKSVQDSGAFHASAQTTMLSRFMSAVKTPQSMTVIFFSYTLYLG